MNIVHRARFVDYSPGNITALSFSHKSDSSIITPPAALRLALGRSNGDIEIWNPRHWVKELTLFGGQDRSIEGLCWSSADDSLRLFSIGGSTVVTEWDLKTGQPLKNYDCNAGVIWSIDINESQTQLAVGCDNGSVVVIDIAGGAGVMEHGTILQRQDIRVLSLAWKQDSHIIGGCADGRIRVWSMAERGRLVSSMKVDKTKDESTLVWNVKYLAKQNQIISGDSTGCVKFWDFAHFTLTQTFTVHSADVLAIAGEDDTVFTTGVDRKLYQFKYSDKWINTSNRLFHANDVRAMCSYQTSKTDFLVSGGVEKTLVINSISNFDGPYRKLPVFGAENVSITGRFVVSWNMQTVKIWLVGTELDEVKNYKLVAKLTLKDEENVSCASLSPDTTVLAVSTTLSTKIFHLEHLENRLKPTKIDIQLPGTTLLRFLNENVLCLATSEGITTIDLEDETQKEYELAEVTETLPYSNLITHIATHNQLIVVSRIGAVDLINTESEQVTPVIRLTQMITALDISETILCVTSDKKIYELTYEGEMTQWCKDNYELPQEFTSLKGACFGCFREESKIWLWSSDWLSVIDTKLTLPIKKKKKHTRDGLEIDEDEEVTQRKGLVQGDEGAIHIMTKYKSMLYVNKLSNDEMIIVERPAFLQPAAFSQPKLRF